VKNVDRRVPIHPSVCLCGKICMDMLASEWWDPLYSVEAVCMSIQSMLDENSVEGRLLGHCAS